MIYDIHDVKNRLGNSIDSFIQELYPNAKKHGPEFSIGDIHGNPGQSFKISTARGKEGLYYDHGDPAVKGNIFQLVMEKMGLSWKEAIEFVAGKVGSQGVAPLTRTKKSSHPDYLEQLLAPIKEETESYLASRGIDIEIAKAYGIREDSHGNIVMTHYDADDNVCLTKHIPKDRSKNMWVNGGKDKEVDMCPTLFGRNVVKPERSNGRIIITEGQWDALTLATLGFPAVSIPMGANNLQWIETEFEYLSMFTDVLIWFDNDEAGERGSRDVVSRLGKDRCLVIKTPQTVQGIQTKDANDILVNAKSPETIKQLIEDAKPEPLDLVVDSATLHKKVVERAYGNNRNQGVECFLTSRMKFRPHEYTVWTGYSGHGKSTALQQQIIYSVLFGRERALVASLEQPFDKTFLDMMKQYTGCGNIEDYPEDFDRAFKDLDSKILMYAGTDRTTPEQLLSIFKHAHKRYGVNCFVIDNGAVLAIEKDGYNKQADAADLFRQFVLDHPVHLHVVLHPRKEASGSNAPAGMSDVAGAGEWVNLSWNVISVFTDRNKRAKIEKMLADDVSPDVIEREWISEVDGYLKVLKQRETGELPQANFYFLKDSKNHVRRYNHRPMFWKYHAPWEEKIAQRREELNGDNPF